MADLQLVSPNCPLVRGTRGSNRGIQEGDEMIHESFTSTSNTDINSASHTEKHIEGEG